MSAAQAPEPAGQDDWMALADALGITVAFTPHPCHSHEFTDPALAAMLASWSHAAAGTTAADVADLVADLDTPVPYLVVDHTVCEGRDCDAVLCLCHDGICPGLLEQACRHHSLLCGDCRVECPECRVDAREDGA